jgi:hypothetical protein
VNSAVKTSLTLQTASVKFSWGSFPRKPSCLSPPADRTPRPVRDKIVEGKMPETRSNPLVERCQP